MVFESVKPRNFGIAEDLQSGGLLEHRKLGFVSTASSATACLKEVTQRIAFDHLE